MAQGPDIEKLATIGFSIVAVLGFGLFILTQEPSVENADALGRFIYAMISIIAPTSMFDVFVSIGIAVVGGISVARQNVILGIIAIFVFYAGVSFILGWIAYPG